MDKRVYMFGKENTEGSAEMKNLLGGKGANLAEMASLGIPVPPGFTITTAVCTEYCGRGSVLTDDLIKNYTDALSQVEKVVGLTFGSAENPLLVSVRSGARQSMPGMMDTVLNVGLCGATIPGLIKKTGNERFVWDSYRRLIMMYADVVMEKAEGIETPDGKGIRKCMDDLLDELKHKYNYKQDTDLSVKDLKELSDAFKKLIQTKLGKPFPDDPHEQLKGAISAVFKSWNGKKAISYRRIENIPDDWGTAVNVQSMVFGNMGESSATGVAFTRNPATGENIFYGEWLINAQGEDVVAGIRTPNPINNDTRNDQNSHLASLQDAMPNIYKQLSEIRNTLEHHFKDMQDIEFTIQEGTLYMLQCRTGKRTGSAALNMAMDMLEEQLIDEKTAVLRVKPQQLDEVLHPIIDTKAESRETPIVKGLPAGPGAASGQVVFTADDAVAWTKAGKKVILLREETNPEDVEGMRAAQGILTARGGMTSHAALVARGWGKCCIVGAGSLIVDAEKKQAQVYGTEIVINEGDIVTLNGSRGFVYDKILPMIDASENPRFKQFMEIVRKFQQQGHMGVRTNADTPKDAKTARAFGAEGIGLFRTEHMFYGEGSDKPLFLLRKMILSNTLEERHKALDELYPFVKKDIKDTMEAMEGLPVTIRLLDPPLHEFVPQKPERQAELAVSLGILPEDVAKRGEELHESNPMMGHRGVRLGITYPEVTEMQLRAIFESAAELEQSGKKVEPEIMVPVTCDVREINYTKTYVDKIHTEICRSKNIAGINFKYGTMIEIPRAALLAGQMAQTAEFFSFGTNDLTQMTFGFSRDDIGNFMNDYLDKKILENDPFQTIDTDGVGELITIAVERGRKVRPDIKLGICGEHGGEPASVAFCYKHGLSYVSCSPYRVPIARLAIAHSVIKEMSGK